MTRQLLLLRHAKSSWDDPSLADHDRPLSKRGRKAAAAMREMMRSKGMTPDLVYVSTARRTMETLEALQPWKRPPVVEVREWLYHAPPSLMFELLREARDTAQSIMLIGHNPGLHELALLLVGGDEMATQETLARRMANAYPTGALALFTIECPWSRIGEGSGKLTHFVVPRELKAAG